MPELPDVEVFRRYAEKHAMNKKIKDIQYKDEERMLKSSRQEISKNLKNNKFTQTKRTGKYLFLESSNNKWLVMHFGMTGYLRYFGGNDEIPDFSKVIFQFDNEHSLSFVSKRKLGKMDITDNPHDYNKKNNIGIDAMDCSFEEFKKALEGKKGGIKSALMDQSKVAGLGNIYSDEILYQENIHPKSKFEKLNEKKLKSLYNTMQRVIKIAVKNEADPKQFPDNYLLPHRQEGKPCPECKGMIKKIKVNGRGTYICAECQKI